MTVPNPAFAVAEIDGKVDLVEYARILNIHTGSARRLYDQGKGAVPVVIGSKYYFDRKEAEEFAKTYRGKPGMPAGTRLKPDSQQRPPSKHFRPIGLRVPLDHFEIIEQLCSAGGGKRPISLICRELIAEALEARGLIEEI